MIRQIAITGVLSMAAHAAMAAPPQGSAGRLAPFYEGLRAPNTGNSCCSIADCRPVSARTVGGHYEIWIGRLAFGEGAPDRWVEVPADVMLPRMENPAEEPVACWTPYQGVLCFLRGPET